MIFNKAIAIAASVIAIAFAYVPMGSSQTITVTISQQANGVQFAFAASCLLLTTTMCLHQVTAMRTRSIYMLVAVPIKS